MEKATREAKVRTSWINPNAEYEAAVAAFVAAALEAGPKNRFLADFRPSTSRSSTGDCTAALVADALEARPRPACPTSTRARNCGTSAWSTRTTAGRSISPLAAKMLKRLRAAGRPRRAAALRLARQLGLDPRDPRIKLFLTWRTLQVPAARGRRSFQDGDYLPLEARGARVRARLRLRRGGHGAAATSAAGPAGG